MHRVMLSFLLACVALVLFTSTTLAHERRTVGIYGFVVGWRGEPAFLDQPNGIDLRITNTQNNQPVTGLEKALKAQVILGGKVKDLELRPRFGTPGGYTADIIPTRPGAYTFRFFGTIEGTPIDERFVAGPGKFDEVDPPSAAQFPEAVPSPSELASLMATASDAVGVARALGLAGIVLGALGLATGALSLAASRRRR